MSACGKLRRSVQVNLLSPDWAGNAISDGALRAALTEFPHLDAHFAGLVSEVGLDAGAGEGDWSCTVKVLDAILV